MNKPQQTNFIDGVRSFVPPHIDLRGDIRPQAIEAWASYTADPLPLPPGWTDADLPDEPTGPVSPTMLAAARRAGQRRVDAISDGIGEDARIRAALADGSYREIERPRRVDTNRGTFPLASTPAVTTSATESAPAPETRYVEGIAHTEPAVLPPGVPPGYRLRTEDDYRAPQGVPDGFGRSRERHLLAKALRSMDDPGDATEAAERAGEGDWRTLRRWASDAAVFLALIAFGAVGGLAIAAAWMGAHGH